jgi:hypothetical protein
MLRVNEYGAVSHVRPIRHHDIKKPNEKQAHDALAKIIAHLPEKAAEKCDEEIDILKRFLCIA